MLHPVVETKLQTVKANLRSGTFTPAKTVDAGSFIIFTNPRVCSYEEAYFDGLPSAHQKYVKDKKVGDIVDGLKIIAIFDDWTGAR